MRRRKMSANVLGWLSEDITTGNHIHQLQETWRLVPRDIEERHHDKHADDFGDGRRQGGLHAVRLVLIRSQKSVMVVPMLSPRISGTAV